MPIPNPSKDEKHEEFISRCMHKLSGEKQFSNEQKVAICNATWQKAKAVAEVLTGRCSECGEKMMECECEEDEEDELE